MFAVAIDGPAGAGKSTLARRTAAAIGFIYVDTGALYRTVALSMLKRKIDIHDAAAVEAGLSDITVDVRYSEQGQRVLLCGEDVSDEIRTMEVSMAASVTSAIPAVRAFLFDLQLSLAEHNNVVMDGRDIGTNVLPHAQVKIFLTASAEERARRRYEELRQKGDCQTYEKVLADVKQRDEQDENRAIAPLRQAGDAVRLDTTELNFEESAAALLALVREKLPEGE